MSSLPKHVMVVVEEKTDVVNWTFGSFVAFVVWVARCRPHALGLSLNELVIRAADF